MGVRSEVKRTDVETRGAKMMQPFHLHSPVPLVRYGSEPAQVGSSAPEAPVVQSHSREHPPVVTTTAGLEAVVAGACTSDIMPRGSTPAPKRRL